MAASAHAPQVADGKLWLGGVEPFRASYGKVMMWFFLISDTFTFSALLIRYKPLGVLRTKTSVGIGLDYHPYLVKPHH